MKNVIYLIVVSFIIGCSSKEETLKTTDDVLTLSIDSIMNANYLPNEPGAAIIITKDGKEIYAKGFGMANLELDVSMTSKMIFRLGSITKQFTAVSILILEEQGKLNLKDNIRKPPSLQNIFKELYNDLAYPIPESGNLEKWAKQGVLLLNATLTVRASQAGSHQNKGWENFTDAVISNLSVKKEKLVFILWGKYAQNKETLVDTEKHFIIKSAHPSPFSADRGFFGSKPFSKTNNYLRQTNQVEIDWQL